MGEVGRGSGKARGGAHGAHFRGYLYPHPRQPQRGRLGGRHAASGMGSPPLGRGPGPPPPPPPPQPSAGGFRPPTPRHGPSAPRRPPPTPPRPHREGKGQGQGKGEGRKRTPRQGGDERPKVAGRRPQGLGTGSDTTIGDETTIGPEREGPGAVAQRERAQRRAPGRTHRKGTPQRMGQHRPTPSQHRATPGGARLPGCAAEART